MRRLELVQGLQLGIHALMGKQLGLVTTLLWSEGVPARDPQALLLLKQDLEELEAAIECYQHDVAQVRSAIERWGQSPSPPAETP